MKHIVKLVRLSSKEAFVKLRNVGEIYCGALDKSFVVTNLFLRHISGSSKNRKIEDIISRLSCVTLIDRIGKESIFIEQRENVIIEGKRKFVKTFKVKAIIKDFEFFLVLGEKND